jgi:hypothetical protein
MDYPEILPFHQNLLKNTASGLRPKGYIDKPWNWGRFGLSGNHFITQEFIEKHMDKPWDWVIMECP